MGAGAQPPIFDLIHRFKKPALFVVGDEDEKFKGIADLLSARMPDARVAVLKGAGHAAHLEAPAEFAQEVREFFAAQGERHE